MVSKYEVFLKIIENGGLTAAADELGCTQSNITHILRCLEEEFGFTLLTRGRSGVRLTPEGAAMEPYVRALTEAEDNLKKRASEIRRRETAVIRVGAFTSVAVNWLPAIIRDYKALRPGVSFKLCGGDYNDIDREIENDEIDVAFVTRESVPSCRLIPLKKDRIMAVLPLNHPLAASDRVKARDLRDENIISLPATSDDDSRAVFDREGFQPNIRFTTGDDYAIIAMVAGGLGISLMPELLLTGRGENVKIRELDPPSFRTISLAIPERCQNSALIAEFAEFVKSRIR